MQPWGQRLVDDTAGVGEDGGGKLSNSSTATPTLLRRVNMQDAATHLLARGLYFSTELRLELPSLPPTAYSQPSMATRSCVLLWQAGSWVSPGWCGRRPPPILNNPSPGPTCGCSWVPHSPRLRPWG